MRGLVFQVEFAFFIVFVGAYRGGQTTKGASKTKRPPGGIYGGYFGRPSQRIEGQTNENFIFSIAFFLERHKPILYNLPFFTAYFREISRRSDATQDRLTDNLHKIAII